MFIQCDLDSDSMRWISLLFPNIFTEKKNFAIFFSYIVKSHCKMPVMAFFLIVNIEIIIVKFAHSTHDNFV